MIENIKVVETEEETSAVPVDDLAVDLQDVTPREAPDYSLTFPETAELLEEPKHFGRLAMWRKLRQLSGTLINALERLENWTEYLFGVNGKITNPVIERLSIPVTISGTYLQKGRHRYVYIYTITRNFIPLNIYIQTSTYNQVDPNVIICNISLQNLTVTYQIYIDIYNIENITDSYTLNISIQGI